MASKTPMFVRDATGLVKNVSLFDAICLNLSNMGGVSVLAVISYTTVLLPTMAGVNLIFASLIGFLIIIPQMIVYTILTQRMPRTGGDYVWVSRTFGGFVGNVAALAGWTLADISFVSFACLTTVFAIGSVGVFQGYGTLIALAYPPNVPGANPILQVLVGTVILVVLVTLNGLKPKLGYRTISVLILIGVFGSVVGMFALIFSGHGGVVNYVNSLAITNTTYTSIANSYSGQTFDLGATLMLMPFFIGTCYAYLNAGPAVASEIKGKNTLKWNVPIALLVQLVVVTGGIGAMYYAGGFNFVNAAFGNTTLVYDYSFNFFTLAMGASGNTAVAWIIGIAWIAWVLATTGYGLIVLPRYFLAQSFDRYLPSVISYVSPKYGSPIVAMAIEFVISEVFIITACLIYGTIISIYGIWVSIMGYFMIVGMAAAVYGAKKEQGRSRVILVISGILMAVVYLCTVYAYFAFPNIWGGNTIAYGYDLAIFVLAIIIYFASKQYNMKRGLDISLVFKQIPPE